MYAIASLVPYYLPTYFYLYKVITCHCLITVVGSYGLAQSITE